MGFRFRKIYADLVTPDGTVVVAYLAWTNAWGLQGGSAGLEIYRPDGTREVLRALSPTPLPPPAEDRRPFELHMSFPGGDALRMHYLPAHAPWSPAGPPPVRGLTWSVRIPRASVTAEWSGSGRRSMRGTGYVDWVELTRPTRALRLRRLEWGRVHADGRTTVFTGLTFRSGEAWRRAATWDSGDDAPVVRKDVAFHEPVGAEPARLESSGDPSAFALRLFPWRVLHSGPAFDRQRSPAWIERMSFRLITGPSQETRWISRTLPPATADPGTGRAIHEVVRFGR